MNNKYNKAIMVGNSYDIAELMIDDHNNNIDNLIVAIGCYETVADILNYLIKHTDSNFVSGELNEPEWDGYDEAYYIEYSSDEIYVGKAAVIKKDTTGKETATYIGYGADKVFVHTDYLNGYLKNNSEDGVVSFMFFEDTDEEYSDNPCIFTDKDNKGFTYCDYSDDGYYQYTYRGVNKLSEEDIKKILDKFVFC